MTVLEQGITLDVFVTERAEDVDDLLGMYTNFLLEEFDRIGELAFGNAAAGYLLTSFIRCDDHNIGFFSLDPAGYSVELIYLKPEYRGRGIATLVLQHLKQHCPQQLALKTPLSPGGEALADKLELGRADNLPHEEATNEDVLQVIRAGIKATCKHGKSAGNPSKPCKRCYQKTLRRYAVEALNKVVTETRQVLALRAGTSSRR
ncbi:GNAT family N-acetyltransferase [Streptomyces sp. NPDC015130]|uniref:GNAT family N-acetyltransferase n=1 Tax=Streptomyces sp. NPDC015130 TaxID=3364940 RepID=UPI0036F6797C